jgi:hypothetical protein
MKFNFLGFSLIISFLNPKRQLSNIIYRYFNGHVHKYSACPKYCADKETDSCLDPELPGTSLQIEGGEQPGPPHSKKNSQLERSRDGENMRTSEEEPILDVMKEDQWPTE